MELFWESVLIGCAMVCPWVWWKSGRTGVLKIRGQTYARDDVPFIFHSLRWFTLLIGFAIASLIPFMSGIRGLVGHL